MCVSGGRFDFSFSLLAAKPPLFYFIFHLFVKALSTVRMVGEGKLKIEARAGWGGKN